MTDVIVLPPEVVDVTVNVVDGAVALSLPVVPEVTVTVDAMGPVGPPGPAGPTGPGVPAGGAATEVLWKVSATDYDTAWHQLTAGDVGAVPVGGGTMTGDLFVPRLGAGSAVAFAALEKLRVNTPTTADALAGVMVAAGSTTAKGVVVQGLAGQTGALQEWQDSTGAAVGTMRADGYLEVPTGFLGGSVYLGVFGGSPQYAGLTNVVGDGVLYQFAYNGATIPQFITGRVRLNDLAFGAWGTVERLRVTAPTTISNTANVMAAASATTAVPVVVQGKAAQAANLLEAQDSTGAVKAYVSSAGTLGSVSGLILGDFALDPVSYNSTGTLLLQNSGSATLASDSIRLRDNNLSAALGTVEAFRVGKPTTVDNAANSMLAASATTAKPLVVQGKASQSATPFVVQTSAAAVLFSVDASGNTTNGSSSTTTGTLVCSLSGRFGSTSYATTGVIRVSNAGAINWRNAANTGDVLGLTVNASNQVVVGGTNQTLIAYSGSSYFLVGNDTVQATKLWAGSLNGVTYGTVEKFRVGIAPTTADNLANAIHATTATTAKGLVIQGIASQAANLFEVQDSTGAVKVGVTSAFGIYTANRLTAGQGSINTGSILWVATAGAANIGSVIQGAVAQTADLEQWLSSTPTTLARMTAGGVFQVNSTGTPGTVEKLRVNTPVTLNNVSNTQLAAGAAADTALTLSMAAASAANPLVMRSSAAVILASLSLAGTWTSSPASASTNAFASAQNGDATNRFQMTASGSMTWGDGTAAVDIQLSRLAANQLAVQPAAAATTTAASFNVYGSGNTPEIRLRRHNGTVTTPTAVNSSDSLGTVSYYGHDGTSYGLGGSVQTIAAENWAVGVHGAYLAFITTPRASTTQATGMILSSGGTLEISGTYTNTPGANEKLRVNTPTTVDTVTNAIISTSATTAKGLVVQGVASQTARLLDLQTSTGSQVFGITPSAIAIGDAVDVVLGTTTGTKLGNGAGQKLGLFNAPPIVQPTTAVAAAAFVANTSGLVNDTATFDGYTIGQVVKALRNLGVLA